jgi:hypothetical protein
MGSHLSGVIVETNVERGLTATGLARRKVHLASRSFESGQRGSTDLWR